MNSIWTPMRWWRSGNASRTKAMETTKGSDSPSSNLLGTKAFLMVARHRWDTSVCDPSTSGTIPPIGLDRLTCHGFSTCFCLCLIIFVRLPSERPFWDPSSLQAPERTGRTIGIANEKIMVRTSKLCGRSKCVINDGEDIAEEFYRQLSKNQNGKENEAAKSESKPWPTRANMCKWS